MWSTKCHSLMIYLVVAFVLFIFTLYACIAVILCRCCFSASKDFIYSVRRADVCLAYCSCHCTHTQISSHDFRLPPRRRSDVSRERELKSRGPQTKIVGTSMCRWTAGEVCTWQWRERMTVIMRPADTSDDANVGRCPSPNLSPYRSASEIVGS